MKMIKFSGMLCHPVNIEKDGDFKIKGTMNNAKDLPTLLRYEHFACKTERDKRFELITKLLKEER